MSSSVVLKKKNEQRFNLLWGSFAKSQTNSMKLSQFMQFIVDRCLLSNKITLKHFYELFMQATQKRMMKQLPPALNTPMLQKTIRKDQFIFLLNELGKFLYHNDKNQQDKVYNDLLGEKTIANKDVLQYSRVMVMDEINRKILMENAIKGIIDLQEEIKNIYVLYIDENYWSMKRSGRLLLNHRQVQLQNKKMSSISFIRLLKEAQILPHLINIQHVEDILSRVVPATIPKESEFYYKHFLVDSYSKDLDNIELKSQGDPGLLFFEFIITLVRIAVQTSKQVENTKKVYDYIINKFFISYLYLRTNQEISQHKAFTKVNKILHNNLRKYYEINQEQQSLTVTGKLLPEEQNLFELLKSKEKELHNLKPIQFNIANMLKILNSQLLPLPQEISIKQQQLPITGTKFKDLEKVIIGQQPPPEKADKKGAPKAAPRKVNLKKGQKPPRIFKYLDQKEQTQKVFSSEDYFQKLTTDLDYSLKPLSSLDRGNIPLDPFPSLITEILYPPEIPDLVLPYIEAGLNAHNQSLFALALDNYQKAYEIWKDQSNVNELNANLQLYFQFTKGSIYLSAGKDDHAFACFFNCRNYSEKIPYLNPDRALAYCGIAQTLYNAQEYELSTRAYLKARQIRQTLLGVDSVDTATVFNNLGCCFYMIDRSKQSLSYLKVACAVLIAELGQFHERTQTARENVNLCNKGFFVNKPEYRKLWQVYENDVLGKKKKKKKKKK